MSSRAAVDEVAAARLDKLAHAIAADLRTRTYVQASADEVGDVGEWRAAARLAGRRLGLRVRTGVRYGYVHVDAIDLPLPEWVRQESERAREALARSLLGRDE